MPDSIRIAVAGRDEGEKLIAAVSAGALNGFRGDVSPSDGRWFVRLVPSHPSASSLLDLFDSLGTWLRDERLASCEVAFGDGVYLLTAPPEGERADPVGFLAERITQLQTALRTRIVIEQAKGVLTVVLGVSPDEAFTVLRSRARSSRRKLHEVAEEVVATRGRNFVELDSLP